MARTVAGLAFILATGIAGTGIAQMGLPVAVDPVTESVEAASQSFLGRFVASAEADVAARISGPVSQIAVDTGDRVAAGDLLVRIADERIAAQLELQQMNLQELAASFDAALSGQASAQQDIARQERLRGSAAFNQARFDEATQALIRATALVNEAQARLRSAEIGVEIAEINLADTRILAPFDGVVIRRMTELGEYLSTGMPVVTLVNDTALEIEVSVPGSRVGALEPGMVVGFSVDDRSGTPLHEAIIRAVLPVEDSLTRSRVVLATPVLDGLPAMPAANQSVTVTVPVDRPRMMVTVHKDAVLTQLGGQFVFVVEDGMAVRRQVQLGVEIADRVEVLAGLDPGELAVIRGNERLQPGQPVIIAPSGPPPGTGSAQSAGADGPAG